MLKEIFSSAEMFWSVYGVDIITMITSITAIVTVVKKVKQIFAHTENVNSELISELRVLRDSNKELTKEVKKLKEQVTRVKENYDE